MFFALSKIASLFLNPLIWIAILSIAALLFRSKRPNLSKKLAGFAILTAIAFTNPMLLQVALRAWEIPPVQPSELKESYPLGIILGGYSNSHDSTPEKLVLGSDPNRLSEGLRLYKTGRINKIVLTGGTGAFFDDGVSEAPLAKKFLTDLGIPETDILVEAKSRNTHENAMFTWDLLSPDERQQTALLITSSVHMRRAQACFAKVGIAIIPYPTDLRGDSGGPIFSSFRSLVPDAWALWQWEFLLREWVGSLAYRLTDRN
ncbi:MAG: YdcF family protein [Verrucomicrobia bacterium]|nr:YdcF family protein [Verrucomicrobiota bacterium]